MKYIYLPTLGQRFFLTSLSLIVTGGMVIQYHFMFWREGLVLGGLLFFIFNTMYFFLTEKEVCKVVGIFFRQQIPIKDIIRVRKGLDIPLQFPTIFLDYTNKWGWKRSLELRIELFGKKQMREFLTELVRLRPDLPMNTECRKFIDNLEPKRLNWKDELIATMFPSKRKKDKSK